MYRFYAVQNENVTDNIKCNSALKLIYHGYTGDKEEIYERT